MKHFSLNIHSTSLACALFASGLGSGRHEVAAGQLGGGAFSLTGTTAGGGTSSGGGYSITGWVAPSGAGTSSGAGFDVTCGLLGSYLFVGGGVSMAVALTEDGRVRVWWPLDVVDYQLEFMTDLSTEAIWRSVTPAPSDNSWVADGLQPSGYFRLRKP